MATPPQQPAATPKVSVRSPLTAPSVPVETRIAAARTPMLFSRMNYLLMIAGLVIIALGFVLMAGRTDIYSTVKITVAPIVVLLGFVVEVYAILYRPKREVVVVE